MRYKADWLIEGQVLALTHFEPVVTGEDFMNIAARFNAAVSQVTEPFHLVIDNRILADGPITPLAAMLHALSTLNHPHLRWIVVILPEAIKEQADQMPVQQHDQIQLRYVDSLATALQHLSAVDSSLKWERQDVDFFKNMPSD